MRRFLISVLSAVLFILPAIYLFLFTIFPFLIQKCPNSFILSGYSINNAGLKIKCDYKLNYNIKLNELKLTKQNAETLILTNFTAQFSPFNLKNSKLYSDKIYFLKTDIKRSKNVYKNKKSFNISNLPEISCNEALIELINPDNTKFVLNIRDFNFKNGRILSKGSIKTPNLNIIAYPKRGFIDNFENFNGDFMMDLIYSNKNISGFVKFLNLSADCIPLKVPVSFKNAAVNFDKDKILVLETGYIGAMPANSSYIKPVSAKTLIYATDIFSPEKEITGSVRADITNAFTKKYIDNLHIKGNVILNVDYYIHSGVSDIFYEAKIPKGSDLTYYKTNFGLIDNDRLFQAVTSKKGDVIKLVRYSYYADIAKKEEIIFGSAVFTKKNGKYSIDNLTGETKKNAPVSLLGFLENRLKGGYFNGILSYDFNNHKLSGGISLTDTQFKNFKIENAIVNAKDDIDIFAAGSLYNEPFSIELAVHNNLYQKLNIKLFDLYLKKYAMKPQIKPNPKSAKEYINELDISNYSDISADEIRLRLDEFIKDKVKINNIVLMGSAYNGVLALASENAFFADGTLNVKGVYDYSNHKIEADFAADNIDADIASYQLFNLKHQVKGRANALMHFNAVRKLENLCGTVSFKIKDGTLPKIASKEFVLNKGHKFKFSLSDIIKIKKKDKFDTTAVLSGNFKIQKHMLDDISLYMQNDFLSLFLEGNYDTARELADLNVWGKYDEELGNSVKIFHIPLSFIMNRIFKKSLDTNKQVELKLHKIPFVGGARSKKFNIKIQGNLNDKENLNVEFNSVK